MSKKANLLIVEDEVILRKRLVSLLNSVENIEIVGTADNGLTAFEMITQYQPDIVLSDIVMPGMDGIELIAKCRESNRNAEFIFISGHKEFDYAQKSIQYRAFAYLLKPLVPEELFFAIDEIIKNKPSKSEDDFALYKGNNSVVRQILEQIERNIKDPDLTLKYICRNILFVNETNAGRLFTKELGIKFTDYVTKRRIQIAVALIHSDPTLTITRISQESGFGDNYRNFIDGFKKNMNMTPKQYQLTL